MVREYPVDSYHLEAFVYRQGMVRAVVVRAVVRVVEEEVEAQDSYHQEALGYHRDSRLVHHH